MNDQSPLTHDDIAARAQAIWEQSGCPDGMETEHWLRAERELQQERSQAEVLERSCACHVGP